MLTDNFRIHPADNRHPWSADAYPTYEGVKSSLGLEILRPCDYDKHPQEFNSVPQFHATKSLCFIPVYYEDGHAIVITYHLADFWKVGMNQLLNDAKAAVKQRGYQLMSIEDILFGNGSMRRGDSLGSGLYVLRTEYNHNRTAIAGLLTDILSEVCDRLKTNELYIIPSSVEEVLVLPKLPPHTEAKDLLSMNQNINSNPGVMTGDLLLDTNVYYFNKSTGATVVETLF